jgi:hypothetical protein
MIDPLSRVGRELKAAEDFFELAKSASSPFLQAYYRRVAERYLSSEGELKSPKRDRAMQPVVRPNSLGPIRAQIWFHRRSNFLFFAVTDWQQTFV